MGKMGFLLALIILAYIIEMGKSLATPLLPHNGKDCYYWKPNLLDWGQAGRTHLIDINHINIRTQADMAITTNHILRSTIISCFLLISPLMRSSNSFG